MVDRSTQTPYTLLEGYVYEQLLVCVRRQHDASIFPVP